MQFLSLIVVGWLHCFMVGSHDYAMPSCCLKVKSYKAENSTAMEDRKVTPGAATKGSDIKAVHNRHIYIFCANITGSREELFCKHDSNAFAAPKLKIWLEFPFATNHCSQHLCQVMTKKVRSLSGLTHSSKTDAL